MTIWKKGIGMNYKEVKKILEGSVSVMHNLLAFNAYRTTRPDSYGNPQKLKPVTKLKNSLLFDILGIY